MIRIDKEKEAMILTASVNSIMQDYYGSQHSSKWSTDFILRIVHATLQIVAFAAGMTVGLSLGWVTSDFGNCVLYTSMTITKDENGTLLVDRDKTEWMSQTMCSYVTYTGVCSAIYAIIWCWFYLLISDWGSRLTATGRPTDLSLLAASIVIGVILLCCSLAAAGIVTEGFKYWCHSVEESLKLVFPEKTSVHCSDLTHTPWTYPTHGARAYRYVTATEVGIWLLTVSFVLQTVIAAVRVRMYSSHYRGSKMIKDKNENFDTIIGPENAINTSYEVNSELSVDRTSTSEFLTPCPTVTSVEVYYPTSCKA